jgi:2-amino-4-hydroxy-6-hydroxymethyldihydropteridine diphosphokinase
MEEVYLSLGSNLGNRFGFLQKAKEGISATIGEIVKTSSIYETSSWGYTDPYLYLNQVIRVKTELSPTDILQNIRKIELENGRTRSSDGYTSRTIDIDILFFGNLIIEDDNIIIPHPRIPNRKFILAP